MTSSPARRPSGIAGGRRVTTDVAALGPHPIQMIAGIPAMRRNICGWLADSQRRWGDVVALPMRAPNVVLLHHPAHMQQVLVHQVAAFDKNTAQYSALAQLTGVGLLTSDGAVWRQMRATMQPAFARPRLASVAEQAIVAANTMADDWLAAGQMPAEQACMEATLGVISATVLDDTAPQGAHQQLIRTVTDALTAIVNQTQLPSPTWLPTPTRRAIVAANRALDDYCAAILAAADETTVNPTSVLGLLRAAHKAGEATAQQVRNELVTMIIAGHETVATSMAWTLGLVARHPEVHRRIHHELDQVLAGSAVTPEHAHQLPYLTAVVQESLRLFPPAWVMSRRATCDVTLPGLSEGVGAAATTAGLGGEVALPAGTVVVLSPWVVHRRAEVFPDPGVFRPERFLTKLTSAQRHSYVPFGAGRRLCIGRDFAMVEQVLMIAELLRRCTIAPGPASSQSAASGPDHLWQGVSPMPRIKPEVTIRAADHMPLWLTPRQR